MRLTAGIQGVLVALRGGLLGESKDARIAEIDGISTGQGKRLLRAGGECVVAEKLMAQIFVRQALEVITSEHRDVPKLLHLIIQSRPGIQAVEILRTDLVIAEKALPDCGLDAEGLREFSFVARSDFREKIAVGLAVGFRESDIVRVVIRRAGKEPPRVCALLGLRDPLHAEIGIARGRDGALRYVALSARIWADRAGAQSCLFDS